MEKGGNNFTLDEEVLNLFSNSLLRTLPLSEAEIARHVAPFFCVGRAASARPGVPWPLPSDYTLLADSSIPASSALCRDSAAF